MTDHSHKGNPGQGGKAKKSGAVNPAHSEADKSHQAHPAKPPTKAHPKGYDPNQGQHPKHPGYNPAHPQGRNPKVVRAKVALQHTHRHGRGEG